MTKFQAISQRPLTTSDVDRVCGKGNSKELVWGDSGFKAAMMVQPQRLMHFLSERDDVLMSTVMCFKAFMQQLSK